MLCHSATPVQVLQQRNRTASDLAHDLTRIWERAEFNDLNDNNRIQELRCCIAALSLQIVAFVALSILTVPSSCPAFADFQEAIPEHELSFLGKESLRSSQGVKPTHRHVVSEFHNFEIIYTSDIMIISTHLKILSVLDRF